MCMDARVPCRPGMAENGLFAHFIVICLLNVVIPPTAGHFRFGESNQSYGDVQGCTSAVKHRDVRERPPRPTLLSSIFEMLLFALYSDLLLEEAKSRQKLLAPRPLNQPAILRTTLDTNLTRRWQKTPFGLEQEIRTLGFILRFLGSLPRSRVSQKLSND